MSYEIRDATRDDAHAVARVWVDSWRAAYKDLLTPDQIESRTVEVREGHWASEFNHPTSLRCVRLLAEDDDGVGGFVTSGPSQDEGAAESDAEIRAIYLRDRAWGTGVGKALLDGAVDGLRAKGFTSAILWVLEENSRARRFYEREGWALDGGRKDCFGGVDAPAVRYRRSLEQPK